MTGLLRRDFLCRTPYIPQWITIFILLLMFSVDFYQNWLERKREKAPVELRRRKK